MKKIIFTKYSNERDDKFKIKTSIIKNEDDSLLVVKSPLLEVGKDHITNMYDSYIELSKVYPENILKINKCELKENSIQFEFIEGETLEKKIDDLLNEKDFKGIFELVSQYYNVINGVTGIKLFEITDDFIKIFGNTKLPYGLKASNISNIDIIFPNIIINSNWNLIDYEWTLNFPIPINYTIYRAVYFYAKSSVKRSNFPYIDILKFLGITEEEIIEYEDMERNFQRFVIGNSSYIEDIYNKIHGKCINIKHLIENSTNHVENQIQVFYDYGNDFNEEDSIISYYAHDEDCRMSFSININNNVKRLRIDPSDYYCIVSIEKFRGYNRGHYYDLSFFTNGNSLNDKTIIFNDVDPQIIVNQIENGTSFIDIEIIVKDIPKLLALYLYDSIYNKKYEIDSLAEQLNMNIAKIRRLEKEIDLSNEENQDNTYKIRRLEGQLIDYNVKIDKIVELEKELLLLNKVNLDYKDEIFNLKNIINIHESNLIDRDNIINEFKNSASWKITRPFRYIEKIVRKVIG